MRKDNIIFGIAIGLIVAITIVIAAMDLFSFTLFLIIVGFIAVYFARYFYIRYGFIEEEKRKQEFFGRIRKFDWCWNRVNEILSDMPGGQGIQWNRGQDVKSSLKTYNNGIAQKPFRAFSAFLAKDNTRIIIIYDIDEDDIVEINQNIREEHFVDMFYGFNPFGSGGSRFGGSRFGDDEFGFNSPYRGGRSGLNINLGNPQSYDSYKPLEPSDEDVDKVFDKMGNK